MKKYSLLLLSALLGMATWSCSDDNDDAPAVVGITAAFVTPQSSAVSYTATVNQSTGEITNTNDPVAWDVTDSQLENATVKVTATVGASVYYNNTVIPAEGLVIDVTAPVTLVAKDAAGTTRSYTMTVTRSTEAAEGQSLVLKSSTFQGFPANVIYYDMAMFKDKFYAHVVSLTGSGEDAVENYEIYNSEDGVNWSKVDYSCSTGVIGGEGARLAVLNNKMFVMGGARTKGADKDGNAAADVQDFWGSTMVTMTTYRLYSTTDGVNYTDESANVTYTIADGGAGNVAQLAVMYPQVVEFKGKLYLKGGFSYGFGQAQSKQGFFVSTSDGVNYNMVDAPADMNVRTALGCAFFVLNGKLWIEGGYRGLSSSVLNSIYSTSDGTTWTDEGELAEEFAGLQFPSVISNGETAIMVGGQFYSDGGSTMNDKMYSTTDGKTWTEVETPANYTARRASSVVTVGNVGWIFGGYNTPSSGFYGFFGDDMGIMTDTWVKLID